jgi:CheY-specific phosphatase CheX
MEIITIKYINFFNVALEKVFKELFDIKTQKVGSYILRDNNRLKDITSFMKLSGDLQGGVLISFTKEVLTHLSVKLIGGDPEDGPAIEDVANEILNIIVGQAKNLIAINYGEVIKLHPPGTLINPIYHPVVINEVLTLDSKLISLGAYISKD